MVIREREITEIGWPYRCPLCDKIVWRDSHKLRYESYCDIVDAKAKLKRLSLKEFRQLIGGPHAE